jgi:hypothetical protein
MDAMRITIQERGPALRERLNDRLERAANLRCNEHGEPVVAVTINVRENGWFDSRWTTCCDGLMKQAAAIVKERC